MTPHSVVSHIKIILVASALKALNLVTYFPPGMLLKIPLKNVESNLLPRP
jgi:hypothetical protein